MAENSMKNSESHTSSDTRRRVWASLAPHRVTW